MIAFDTNVLVRLVVNSRHLVATTTVTFDSALHEEDGFTWIQPADQDV